MVYSRQCSEVTALDPETEIDHLLMAHSLVLIEPRRAQRLIEDTPAGGNSAIGLLTRGVVRSWIGCDEQDMNQIDSAVRDIDKITHA